MLKCQTVKVLNVKLSNHRDGRMGVGKWEFRFHSMEFDVGKEWKYVDAFYEACTVGQPDEESVCYILNLVPLPRLFVLLSNGDEVRVKKIVRVLKVVCDSKKGTGIITSPDMVPYLLAGLEH